MNNNVLEQLNTKMKDDGAEAEILSMLIAGPNSEIMPLEQADIMSILKPEYFSNPTHIELFGIVCEMYGTNRDLTQSSIKAMIGMRSKNSRVKPLRDEVDKLAQYRVVESYTSLIERLKEVYKTRSFYNEVLIKGDVMFSQNEPIDAIIEQVSDSLMHIDMGRKNVEISVETPNVINRILNKDAREKGLTTGLTVFDRETGGVRKDRYYAIGAESGAGKTAVLVDLIYRLCEQHSDKIAILFFSMEMSEERIIQRLISRGSRLTNQRLEENKVVLSPFDRTSIMNTGKKVAAYPLTIVYDVLGCSQMELQVRKFALKHKGKHIMVMLDHIGLVVGKTNDIRVNTISASAMMKGFCTRYKASSFVLTQFTKEIDSRENARNYHRPHMGYIMESGRIRQDADVVILLWRPETRFPHIHYHGMEQWITKDKIIFMHEKERDGFAPFDDIYDCEIGANVIENPANVLGL